MIVICFIEGKVNQKNITFQFVLVAILNLKHNKCQYLFPFGINAYFAHYQKTAFHFNALKYIFA